MGVGESLPGITAGKTAVPPLFIRNVCPGQTSHLLSGMMTNASNRAVCSGSSPFASTETTVKLPLFRSITIRLATVSSTLSTRSDRQIAFLFRSPNFFIGPIAVFEMEFCQILHSRIMVSVILNRCRACTACGLFAGRMIISPVLTVNSDPAITTSASPSVTVRMAS